MLTNLQISIFWFWSKRRQNMLHLHKHNTVQISYLIETNTVQT